ncbi:hypothetical protein HWV62_26973 [Athelia sp. TMB]|nr:hypothetical protein HWV62_26973 [Athelia sp. TMB]
MDIAPPEIWTRISSYACTDAGSTGRSLSLVSKFIRDTSAPFKLQSMSIHGSQQAIAFQGILLRTPPHLRRVRYLYLSATAYCPSTLHTSSPFGVADLDGQAALNRFDLAFKLRQLGKRDAWNELVKERRENTEKLQQIVIALNRILQITSEWVEILYLDGHDPFHVTYSPLIIFPRLEELASRSVPVQNPPSDSDVVQTPVVCPKLRRWHLMSLPTMQLPRGGGDIFSTIATIAPSITDLFFSGLQLEIWFPSHLNIAFDGIQPQQSSSSTDSGRLSTFNHPISCIGRLPKSIENVYLKPAPAPGPGGRCDHPYMCYEGLKGEMEALSRADNRIVLLPSYIDHRARCTVSEWEERINGGDGCWSLRDRITN